MMGADLLVRLTLSGLGWSNSSDMMGADLLVRLTQDGPVYDGPMVVI